MNKIIIEKENVSHEFIDWASRGWYVTTKGGSHYLTPNLAWQLGALSPINCFCKTRKEARLRLKAFKALTTQK